MAEPFCEFGMLPVASCAHCRERRGWSFLGRTEGPQPALLWTGPVESPEFIDWREQWRYLMELAAPWLEGEGRWLLAQYDGRCRGCGERIYEGDSVRYSHDEGGYICLSCGT